MQKPGPEGFPLKGQLTHEINFLVPLHGGLLTQQVQFLDDIRAQWPLRDDGKRDGLTLFSGDVFAPSVDSSVTRGSHMVRLHSLPSQL